MSTPRYISLDGRLVPFDDAKIHVLSPAVRYGATVFEGICGYWNEDERRTHVFRLKEHLVRLQHSMRLMRFDAAYSLDQLTDTVLELVAANDFDTDCHIRLSAYVIGDPGIANIAATGPIGLICAAIPRKPRALEARAITCGISSWRRIDDSDMPPRIKAAANYQNGRLGLLQARADGYNEVLFLTGAGKLAEGAGACFFMIRDGKPSTPETTHSILESITRDTLIRLFKEYFGSPVEERTIDRTETYIADEAFLCGSGYEIAPITSIDRLPIGAGQVGPKTRALWEKYDQITRGLIADHAEWRTPVAAAQAAKRQAS
ncbi:MAG: branched-chain-amino-acid transaminase [Alphaproteobacteria bacterium]